MGFSTIPRRVGKLEYAAVRLPFILFEDHLVARYWDDEAALRLGFEWFLGSLDGVAGWLLADEYISRRGQALRRRTEFLAKAGDLDTKAQARRAQAEEKLQIAQAQTSQTRVQAREELNDEIAASYQQLHEDKQQARQQADARADADKAQAKQTAQTRAAQAEQAQQAEQDHISAEQDQVKAAASQQLSDAAKKHTSATDRRQEADRLDQLATNERDERHSS
jgi:hypothetical protein